MQMRSQECRIHKTDLGEHWAQDRQRFENQLETGNNHDSPFPSFGRMLSLDAASLLLEGRGAEKIDVSKN